MNNKKYSIVALISLFLGAILVFIGIFADGSTSLNITSKGFEFQKFDETSMVTQAISDEITSFDIDVEYLDISVSTGDEFAIVYHSPDIEIIEKDGSLAIKNINNSTSDNLKTFITMDLSTFQNSSKDIYLTIPNDKTIDTVNINLQSGDLRIADQNVSLLHIANDYGDIKLENIHAKDIVVSQRSGDLKARNMNSNSLDVNNDYGDVSISDSNSIVLNSVMSSGDLHYKNSSIDHLTIENDYGDVNLKLLGNQDDYEIIAQLAYGEFEIGSKEIETPITIGNGNKKLDLTLSSGDAIITFVK